MSDTNGNTFAPAPPTPDPTPDQLQQETTGRQGFAIPPGLRIGRYGIGNSLFQIAYNPYYMSACGNQRNPCGFPGWGTMYRGTYETYRFIRSHPKIAHARSIILDPILAAPVALQVREGSPTAWGSYVEETILPLRRRIYEFLFRGVDFGCVVGEKVWRRANGRWEFDHLKPLLNDITAILTDEFGAFAGLSQGNLMGFGSVVLSEANSKNPALGKFKAFLYTHDREAGDWYGRSRFENVRETAWRDWLDASQQLQNTGNLISSVQPLVKVPPGGYNDQATGKEISYREDAANAIEALVNGQGMVVTSTGIDPALMRRDPAAYAKLVNLSMTDVVLLDFGSRTPAIEGFLKRMEHAEDLMYEGMLRSPRTGSQTRGGASKADSQQHTETGNLDSQMLASDFDLQVSGDRQMADCGIIDDALELQFGPSARGAIQLQTAPTDNPTITASKNLIGMLAQANPVNAQRMADSYDMDQLAADANLKVRVPYADTKAAPPPVQPGGSQPGDGIDKTGGKGGASESEKNPQSK